MTGRLHRSCRGETDTNVHVWSDQIRTSSLILKATMLSSRALFALIVLTHQMVAFAAGTSSPGQPPKAPSPITAPVSQALGITQMTAADLAINLIQNSGELRASLRAGGQGLLKRTVIFRVGAEIAGSSLTDSNGLATFNWNVPESAQTGTRSWSATFDGDERYQKSSATAALILNPTSTSVTIDQSEAKRGESGTTIHIRGKLLDVASSPLKGVEKMQFSIDGTILGSLNVQGSGEFSGSLKTVQEGHKLLVAEFQGNGRYAKSSTSSKVFIPVPPKKTAHPFFYSLAGGPGGLAVSGIPLDATVSVSPDLNISNVISGVELEFTATSTGVKEGFSNNQVFYKHRLRTDSDGYAHFKYQIPSFVRAIRLDVAITDPRYSGSSSRGFSVMTADEFLQKY